MSDEAPEPAGPPAEPIPQAGPMQMPLLAAEPQPEEKDRETTVELIRQIERSRRSRVLVYWTSPLAKMADAAMPSFYDQLSAIGDVERLDLVLQTNGGDVEIPWRMVSLAREFAERFSVIVPHRAASAGTILALGADEIVMTRFAVLGPIDPSRTHPLLPRRENEVGEPVSVQDMRHAMQFIREAGRAGEEFAYTPEAMAEIFTALFDKLHPLAIGAIEQSYALAKLVATRCLETHMTGPGAATEIQGIVDRLCDSYKSHAYQIPRSEAKTIPLKVKFASKSLDDRVMRLYRHYVARPMGPPALPPAGIPFKSHIAWLDSSSMQLRCVGEQLVQVDGATQYLGDRWVAY
jgi:hypothetical protein